jgi:transposase-like protein
MPTVARCPRPNKNATDSRRAGSARAELFAAGVRQAEVACQLGVTPQAVSVWHAGFKAGGSEAPHSRGPTGAAPKIADAQLAHVEQPCWRPLAPTGSSGSYGLLTASGW